MARERRPEAWWRNEVARWRQSGKTASEFAKRESYSANTLRWWSSRLGRDTRAEHASPAVTPIEIALGDGVSRVGLKVFEVVVGDALVRCDVGTDVHYVADLARTGAGRRVVLALPASARVYLAWEPVDMRRRHDPPHNTRPRPRLAPPSHGLLRQRPQGRAELRATR